jgi:hypothetical protein
VFHHAEEGRRIGELRGLGEEAPDLDLRMGARLQTAQQLEHHLRADGDRRVALLRVERTDLARLEGDFGIEGRGGGEDEAPGLGGDFAPFPHALDHRHGEARRGRSPQQQARAGAAPHAGDRVLEHRLVLAALIDRHGHEVVLALAGGEVDGHARQ